MGVCLSQARHGGQPSRADSSDIKASQYKWTNENFFSISEQRGSVQVSRVPPPPGAVARSVLNDRVNVINYSTPKVLAVLNSLNLHRMYQTRPTWLQQNMFFFLSYFSLFSASQSTTCSCSLHRT